MLIIHLSLKFIKILSTTLSRRDTKISRLYEQGASKQRIGKYLARWLGWGSLVLMTSHSTFTTAATCNVIHIVEPGRTSIATDCYQPGHADSTSTTELPSLTRMSTWPPIIKSLMIKPSEHTYYKENPYQTLGADNTLVTELTGKSWIVDMTYNPKYNCQDDSISTFTDTATLHRGHKYCAIFEGTPGRRLVINASTNPTDGNIQFVTPTLNFSTAIPIITPEPLPTPEAPTIPAAPTNLTATALNTSAVFTFTPGYDGGTPITGYNMNCGGGTDITAGSLVTTTAVINLTNGTAYECSVTATNAQGSSSPSQTVVVIPTADKDEVDTSSLIEDGVPPPTSEGITGDGNGDGTKDSLQNHVASLKTKDGTEYITIVSSGNKNLASVSAIAAPSDVPSTHSSPFDAFKFKVAGLSTFGDTEDLALYLPYDADISAALKKNRLTGEWDNIATAITHIGTTKTKITFSLKDGGPYDVDGLANGTIEDPIVPAKRNATIAPVINLAENNLIQELQATSSIVGDGKITLKVEEGTGFLQADIGESKFLLRPFKVEVASEGVQPGIQITNDGLVQLITDGGNIVTSLAEPQQIESLVRSLSGLGLELQQSEFGLIKVSFNVTRLSGSLWYALRAGYESNPAETGAKEGIIGNPSEAPINTVQYRYYYYQDDKLYRQTLYPTSADWNVLKTKLASLGDVSRDIEGIITLQTEQNTFRGIMDYKVVSSTPGAEKIQLLSSGDINGDGIGDFLVIYLNGDKQILYVLSVEPKG
jgi:Fibronectin type III domain